MDGDLQHPPETLADLLQPLRRNEGEIAIASRHVRGGGVSHWSLWRRAFSWGAACVATFFLPGILRHVKDPMSGFFALRRQVLEGVTLHPQGYKILLDVLMHGRFATVVEVPYIFEERFRGGSKLGKKQVVQFFARLFRLSVETGHAARLAKYLVTGSVGGVVTLGSLLLLRSVTDLPLVSAYSLAVELAILNNFLLNEFWTFADAAAKSARPRARAIRFIRFNGTCVWGAVFNVGTFLGLRVMVQLPVVAAGLVGVTVGYVWNYGVNANATWLDLFPPKARKATAKPVPHPGYYYQAYTHGNRVQRFWHRGKFGRVLSRPRQHPILDVGSGPGVLSALLQNGSHLVVSLDRSFEVIRFAKQAQPDVCGVVADVRHLPFRPGQFRTIFFVEVIEHIPAQWSLDVLRELRDMLHPAGRLILTTPNYRSLWPALEWMVSRWGPIDYTKEHVNRYSPARLEQEVRQAGLKVISAESFFVVAPFLAWLSERTALKALEIERRCCGRWGSILLFEAGKS
jgi:putative flippase GtrA/SAM-dependent methyltransferase